MDRVNRDSAYGTPQGQINISGGEPFVRTDFMELLDVFSANRKYFRFAILTNGTLIDAAMARRLRTLQPAFVQVSLEGSQPTHDAVRGKGTFDRTVAALRHLKDEGVRAVISFTAHRENRLEFPEVARLGGELRVARVWADRLIPLGAGAALEAPLFSPEETREFFESMYAARSDAAREFGCTEVHMGRALQFLAGGGTPYRCEAGNTLVTVQPNGDLYPCRRMPIRVGNVMDTPLADLYFSNALFESLRAHRISDGCASCSFASKCRGGLRCLSYAVTGDPFKPDPGCWRVETGKASSGVLTS